MATKKSTPVQKVWGQDSLGFPRDGRAPRLPGPQRVKTSEPSTPNYSPSPLLVMINETVKSYPGTWAPTTNDKRKKER
ncbi:hypothetical protein PG995_012517 [Apiospora arundinis]